MKNVLFKVTITEILQYRGKNLQVTKSESLSFFNFNFLLLFNYSCVPFLPIPPPHPSWTPPPSPTSTLPLDFVHVSFIVAPVNPSLHSPPYSPLAIVRLFLMFIAAQFTIAKYWKQPKCPSANEWIQKLWYIHNGILRSREKEGAYTLCNSMDRTGEHYAKWNKPGGEGQRPYDLTFNWNIINRRKKQTKYNQTLKLRTT